MLSKRLSNVISCMLQLKPLPVFSPYSTIIILQMSAREGIKTLPPSGGSRRGVGWNQRIPIKALRQKFVRRGGRLSAPTDRTNECRQGHQSSFPLHGGAGGRGRLESMNAHQGIKMLPLTGSGSANMVKSKYGGIY